MLCNLCPRHCNIERSDRQAGYCGEGDALRVARIAPHHFEEPPVSGTRGSGTVFFSGCSLRCVFCQNKDISRRGGAGKIMTDSELYKAILELQESGVHNVNLVTPTHFTHRLAPLLERLRASGDLRIPVVYNSSGYESAEALRRLEGLIDIYMPDFKYFSSELSTSYSSAPDYLPIATEAVREMHRQVGRYEYSDKEPDILQRGLIVRHLVLPGCRRDSVAVLEHLAEIVPVKDILLSLMSQYTPEFAADCTFTNLHRRVTTFEYSAVVEHAQALGFEGFIQAKSSATAGFTPDFTK